ncbi:hypothetical protein B5F40_07375 [Gordonibacter sp. An230]|nr:hypothetical protein B5F40_07375 [Gordonibacter sp. An230]
MQLSHGLLACKVLLVRHAIYEHQQGNASLIIMEISLYRSTVSISGSFILHIADEPDGGNATVHDMVASLFCSHYGSF